MTSAGPQVSSGRSRQKLRTKRQLLDVAVALITAGGTPTVAEVADAAEVSRRTAYRYFPSQEKLLTEAALEGARTAIEAELDPGVHRTDVGKRLDSLIENVQRQAIEKESLLRTMIHLTVLEKAEPQRPRRGMRRVDWIETALQPLRGRLGSAAYAQLVSALTLCVGIEALLVFRDIRGLTSSQAVAVSRWMARAVLAQSLREARRARRGSRKKTLERVG
jgi:AcrR family transcriptional regulator